MEAQQAILTRAYELAGEYGVTRGSFARMDDGSETTYGDPRATSFCTLGLIGRACLDLGYSTIDSEGRSAEEFCAAAETFRGFAGIPHSITLWNDENHDLDEVKRLLRLAAGIPDQIEGQTSFDEEWARETVTVG